MAVLLLAFATNGTSAITAVAATRDGAACDPCGDFAEFLEDEKKDGVHLDGSTLRVTLTFEVDGQAVNIPGAFTMRSDPVVLPAGEIQTRVDSTG